MDEPLIYKGETVDGYEVQVTLWPDRKMGEVTYRLRGSGDGWGPAATVREAGE